MRWINSEGGPLIMLADPLLEFWQGCNVIGESPTDYDRACAVEDVVGLVNVGSGFGLVLGDEPFQTAWIPLDNRGRGTLVRWIHADSEDAVVSAMSRVPDEVFQSSGLIYPSDGSRMSVFDSALSGRSLAESEVLKLDLPRGHYDILTSTFRPDENTAILLHRLIMLDM